MNSKRATLKSVKDMFLGKTIVTTRGTEGKVYKVEAHLTAGGFMHARTASGETFVAFPNHVKFIKVEKVEVIGYTLHLDELIA